MKNTNNISNQYKNQILELSKEDLLQVYDYMSNQLYTYFENDLIPHLKSIDSGWMFDKDCKTARDKQREFL
jgi:hypothetical protein